MEFPLPRSPWGTLARFERFADDGEGTIQPGGNVTEGKGPKWLILSMCPANRVILYA